MNEFQTRSIAAAKEALASSEVLITQRHYSSAISRAYYAMFHLAQAILEAKQLSFSKHSAVISAFGREFAKPGLVDAKLHRYMIEAEDDRLKADYDVMTVLNQETAEKHFDRAREFLEQTLVFLGCHASKGESEC